jgi:hypothetical protein
LTLRENPTESHLSLDRGCRDAFTRMQFLLRACCLAAILAPALAACASAGPATTPRQTAAINAMCDKVMKLWPGAEFEACASSLSDTLASMEEADYTNVSRRACLQAGIAGGTPQFSRCILDRQSAEKSSGVLPTGIASKLDAAMIKPVDSDRDYYMDSSIPVRRRRERYACAELGLNTDTGAFEACTDELETQIYFVDHPNS